jgi:hypothetical protein
MSDPLRGLDDVDWANVKHAYGPATDVPSVIRALMSPDPEKREQALHRLYSNIFHQGTRYQATPYAVPFLLEMLRDPSTHERADIVDLLASIAIGYDENFIPNGVDPAKFRTERHEWDSKMSVGDRADCNQYGFGSLVDVACYDAVAEGVPLILSFLDDVDPDLRCAATYLVAWFPEHAATAIPALHALLARATEPLEQAYAILSLGLLARNSAVSIDRETVLSRMGEPHSLLIRTSAALALRSIGPEDGVIDLLIEAVASGETLNEQSQGLRFNDGNLVGFAGLVISQARSDQRERAIAALCRALESVNPFESLDVTRALLNLVIDGSETYNFFKQRPSSQLTPLQRQVLLAILNHGGWHFPGPPESGFGNYSLLLADYGLPSTQKKLRAYLEV